MRIRLKYLVRVSVNRFLSTQSPTENLAYPGDEAGSYEAFAYRQSVAPSLFLGIYDQCDNDEKRLIGFICSTLSKSESLTHESMTVHDPEGKTICVHSVCVDPGCQRRGIGSALLKEYTKRWTDGPFDGISLIAHEELIKFYVDAGFKLIGKSEVVHGSKPWFELRCSLQSQVPDIATQHRILEALQNNRSGVHQLDKKLASHYAGCPSELVDRRGMNKLRLYCPRMACRSVILLEGVATFVKRPSIMVTVYITQVASRPYSDFRPDRQSSGSPTTGYTPPPLSN
jgi:guanine nucleotide exchange factor